MKHRLASCLRALLCLALLLAADGAHARRSTKTPARKTPSASRRVQIHADYRSPRNGERPRRKSTLYIILHTTEGGARGSLEKLSANGECHYVVNTDGRIYSIIDRHRVAYHAGVSMWKGRTGLDACSIGIEIVGYHNREPTTAQYTAVRSLLLDLKAIYKIPDENVLTHSMVAYGNPNRWQRKRHRGRKRCAMLLALPTTRAKLGLYSKPTHDPDVKAGRLVDADPELARILYKQGPPRPTEVKVVQVATVKSSGNVIGPGRTAWDIARDLYSAPGTIYTFPDGTRKKGSEIRNWKSMPAGTKVEISSDLNENPVDGLVTLGADGTAAELAGDDITAASTFYFPPSSGLRYKSGSSLKASEVAALPKGTKMLVGYSVGGPVSAKRPVFEICNVRWNRPDTYYLTADGKLTPGDKINEKSIPAGAIVFFRQ
ncbi:MAG: N-acetylmuramoyl-L-alanine amidase [Kiritimatiellia bacterium]